MSITERSTALPPATLRAWLAAIRPKTLSMAIVPVFAGSALAWQTSGHIDTAIMLAALMASLCIQAATNLYNDAADFQSGNDGPDRKGPPRMSATGLLSPAQVKNAALYTFALAALPGIWLTWIGGWPILLLGVFSILSGYAYSGGPRPVSHMPLGEVFVIAFFGIAATGGSYYLQTANLSLPVIIYAMALGAFAAAVLFTNNTRDRKGDKRAGRTTLAILCGPRPAKYIYTLLVTAPYILLPVAAVFSPSLPAIWLPFASLPLAIFLIRSFAAAGDDGYNLVLVNTARLQLVFAVLLCANIILLPY